MVRVNLDKSWLDYRGIAQVLVREGVGREVVMKGPGNMSPDEVKAAFGADLWALVEKWEGLTSDHTDQRSIKDPDGGWGWCLRQGATMIQTDSPVECGAWLRKIGRHEGF